MFPGTGVQYRKHVARGRTGILIAYLRSITRTNVWAKSDSTQDVALYEAFLRAGVYEDTLHGLPNVGAEAIDKQARSSSKTMWKFLSMDCG